jgi:hypothetical protein
MSANAKRPAIRRFGVRSIELRPGEALVAQVTAWHHQPHNLWNLAGYLFLTNQRVIFRKSALAIGHGHEWNLVDIKGIGHARLSRWQHVGGLLDAWYIQVDEESHYFSPWLIFGRGWFEKLQGITGLSPGEPRALYS